MANPLLVFFLRRDRAGDAGATPDAGRRRLLLPEEPPDTDVVFLVLRRMRRPIIISILIFSTSVLGLVLIPGKDSAGQPTSVSVFDAFYFVAYTATTIGFGEIVPFTAVQRMWVTGMIFASVVTWAYAFGTVLTLVQEPAFQRALRMQRFRHQVRRIREPFVIVAGFGLAGRQVCSELEAAGRRFVVVDRDLTRLDVLAGSYVRFDTPYLHADAAQPKALLHAGLGQPNCAAVLALTSEDEANLAVTMTATMLRPDVQVISRCVARIVTERMEDFSPTAIINAADRFGEYLLLALRRPNLYRLVTWLMSPEGSAIPAVPARLAEGRWVICGAGGYARHMARELGKAGLDTTIADPDAGHPDVAGADGFVAATPNDILNLALAEHVRHNDDKIFIAVRQRTDVNTETLRAMGVDSVFIPTDLMATETLARIITPAFWDFVLHAFSQTDEWGAHHLTLLTHACGTSAPRRELVTLSHEEAPAASRWLGQHPLSLGDLLRDPDHRDRRLQGVVLQLVRGDEQVSMPDPGTLLRVGDQLLVAGRGTSLQALSDTLHHDATVHYVATGEQLPTTWLWRWLVLRRRSRRATR